MRGGGDGRVRRGVAERSGAAAPGTGSARSRSHWATSARTSEKPFEWSPDDARPTIASPARAADPSMTRRARRRRSQHPARSNSSASISPGCSAVSPPTSAQPASRQPAATRTDELGDPLRDEVADRDVVEEGERLGAGADDVVGAHRDEVDADRVEATERRGDRGLRADAVGRGDEQRLAIAGRDGERAAEPAEPADDLRPAGRLDVRPHQVDRALAGGDVDAGRPVGGPVSGTCVPGPSSTASTRGWRASTAPAAPFATDQASAVTGSSSMNLRLAASYGTGSG